MDFLKNLMKLKKSELSLDEIAEMLGTNPEAIVEFENAYHAADFAKGVSDNYFEVNAKQASELRENDIVSDEATKEIARKIVNEFISQTIVYSYEREATSQKLIDFTHHIADSEHVTPKDIKALPKNIQPQCTGLYTKRDIPNTGKYLLYHLNEALTQTDTEKVKANYHLFRQGLDILDLDELTYSMIDNNPSSMGNWLPKMTKAVDKYGFFKIPNTKIIKVPITMLQLTRQVDYPMITKTTLDIVDNYCHEVFGLDDTKKYFVKTGIRSNKQDFRNVIVQGEKEVKELGEYLLYLHQRDIQMASPLCHPRIYGAGTTVEWVVREYIDDVEDNPTIYHGMPLHTEYRVFVDFDTKEVLGIHNYWDPDVMLNHFKKRAESNPNDIDAKHDYITYSLNKECLVNRYEANKNTVMMHVAEFIKDCDDMYGQWSIDIMQNGTDFWFIDAAIAENSAFYTSTVPEELRRKSKENWLPDISLPALASDDTNN